MPELEAARIRPGGFFFRRSAENSALQNLTFPMSDEVTNPKLDAAYQLALDELTDTQIAERVGVSRQTIYNWKQEPEFQEIIDEHRRAIADAIRKQGIAIVENRVKAQNDRWKKLHKIAEERSRHESMQDIPGGRSGFLVRRHKSIGSGDNAREVVEYEVDVGLLREMREHEDLVARELGQREMKIGLRGRSVDSEQRTIDERLSTDPDAAIAAENLYFQLFGNSGDDGSSPVEEKPQAVDSSEASDSRESDDRASGDPS